MIVALGFVQKLFGLIAEIYNNWKQTFPKFSVFHGIHTRIIGWLTDCRFEYLSRISGMKFPPWLLIKWKINADIPDCVYSGSLLVNKILNSPFHALTWAQRYGTVSWQHLTIDAFHKSDPNEKYYSNFEQS